jgi:spore germination protein YaaH
MKICKYVFVLLLIAGLYPGVDAQLLKENEIVVIQGQKFVIHQVRTGETLYSISRQYETDSQTLAEHNPKINDGLKVGEMLRIPYKEGVNWQQPVSYSLKVILFPLKYIQLIPALKLLIL